RKRNNRLGVRLAVAGPAILILGAIATSTLIGVVGAVTHPDCRPPGPADAIVVLTASDLPGGRPSDASRPRGERAADLWLEGLAPIVVSTGGGAEAEVLADVMFGRQVPRDAVLLEDRSRTTLESAYNVAMLARVHDWRRIILVSSAAHLARSRWMF